MSNPEAFKIDIQHCARCEGNHADLEFTRLRLPVKAGACVMYEYWAPCPTTGEPIMLALSDDDDPDESNLPV